MGSVLPGSAGETHSRPTPSLARKFFAWNFERPIQSQSQTHRHTPQPRARARPGGGGLPRAAMRAGRGESATCAGPPSAFFRRPFFICSPLRACARCARAARALVGASAWHELGRSSGVGASGAQLAQGSGPPLRSGPAARRPGQRGPGDGRRPGERRLRAAAGRRRPADADG